MKRAREAAQHFNKMLIDLRSHDEKTAGVRNVKLDLLAEAGERACVTKEEYIECCGLNEDTVLPGRRDIER